MAQSPYGHQGQMVPLRVCIGTSVSIVKNYIDEGMEYTLSKFAADTQLRGAADMPEKGDAIQGDLGRLKEWGCGNLMRLNKTKGKVP
ncbi:hypothetical protein TURU_160576 [Turdus rufiventris]|nr:hypothetical protein TURU_160576 [Turdus rufiventris]